MKPERGPFGHALPRRIHWTEHRPHRRQTWLRDGAGRRRMRRGWPQAQVREDLFDDLGLVNEGDLCGAPHNYVTYACYCRMKFRQPLSRDVVLLHKELVEVG